MENASKALIIAGAIILSILIIGLGMMIFNSAKDTIGSANLDPQKIASFNGQFENYTKDNTKGANAKSLCDTVRNNNLAADDSETFTVGIVDKTTGGVAAKNSDKPEGTKAVGATTAADINAIKAKLKSGTTYKITAEYDGPSGTINSITIEDATK